jgi:proteasome lid subunit RPN8/RPN11
LRAGDALNDEIKFGDMEHAAPKRAPRPDEDQHYAVAAYGHPRQDELPIFVDLDVLAEMEQHALSDTSVELGGVLLGGRHIDSEGRPFVVITECLRAAHYESTKGSFKFTHQTWSAITRQRQGLSPELQMVGWYHTHPDWGVFLSGMDLFICDHFFRDKLDVAYVIDPCRGDRGMFQWTDAGQAQDERKRMQRTGGFLVTASRFRTAELDSYVAEFNAAMSSTSTRSTGGSYPAPIVHLHQPHSTTPPWQAAMVFAMLALQSLLVVLIAWRLLAPVPVAQDSQVAAALDKLNASLATAEARRGAELAEARAKARSEFLDEAFRELKGADSGAISRLQSRFDQSSKLAEDIAARDAQIRELRTVVEEAKGKLKSLEMSAQREEQRLKAVADKLEGENGRLRTALKSKEEKLVSLAPKVEPDVSADDRTTAITPSRTWWWVAAGALVVAAVAGACWWVVNRGGLPLPTVNESAAVKDM